MRSRTAGGVHDVACLIVARNLGDAVIQSVFARDWVRSGYARHYIVWTRPQVGFIFEGAENCEIVASQFPVGTSKQFDRKGVSGFLKAVHTLRRRRITVTLDLIGDFRERIFARLIGSREHQHIGWEVGHPFREIIRNPFGVGEVAFEVPASTPNVYEAHRAFLARLTGEPAAEAQAMSHSGVLRRVGLHPFASQQCKLWPESNWRDLASQLAQRGIEVVAYGAPSERSALERMFLGLTAPVEIVTRSISEFADHVSHVDLLVGLDSFSVHMADRQRVPSVMLNACNNPALWRPTMGRSLSQSGGCSAYPCMNVPVCESDAHPYRCIRSISVEQVLSNVISGIVEVGT